jgi:hypothetical protein
MWIQRGVAEGAGDARHEPAALQFHLQPEGEVAPGDDIEPRVEDSPFREGRAPNRDILLERNLEIGRATPPEFPERLSHPPRRERAIQDTHNLGEKDFIPEGLTVEGDAPQGEEGVRDGDGAVLWREECRPICGLQQARGFHPRNMAAPDIKRLVLIPALGSEDLR